MTPKVSNFWVSTPISRLLISLVIGIVLQQTTSLPKIYGYGSLILCFLLLIVYSFLQLQVKFRLRMVSGSLLHLLFLSLGCLLVMANDIRQHKYWVGNLPSGYLILSLQEDPVEKPNSYKSLARVIKQYDHEQSQPAEGWVILYFKKEDAVKQLHYGSNIIIHQPLQRIQNTGNPGNFDYQQYCLFQGITHQTYLTGQDFCLLSRGHPGVFRRLLQTSREWVISMLKKYISGQKEQGLAEALLIGYKDDLDKKLVRSYSRTGVVHIIAISGLHLGLIYGLLLLLTQPLRKNRKLQWFRFVLIVSSLWGFSILAGAQPSILRSAVMFSFIALAEPLSRRNSVYNTLCLSAFLLLCIHPFWLWDLGFQLSYGAVISIMLFFQPIYQWFSFENKVIRSIWKVNAVTIAAQILVLPISIYQFHQFPVLFLLTNVAVVPLSTLIVIGEILLCCFSFIGPAASWLGKLLEALIRFMNFYIERLDHVSFVTWNDLYVNASQAFLLTFFILAFSYWLLYRKRFLLWISAALLFFFVLIRSLSIIQAENQRKLIVYNVPHYQAIDLMYGQVSQFIGDQQLLKDQQAYTFYIAPSHILHRIEKESVDYLHNKAFIFQQKRILIIDTTMNFSPIGPQPDIDILILSHNPKIYINRLIHSFHIRQVVIDSSVPSWKARLWQHDCDSLHIPCYNVAEKGAYITADCQDF